MASLEGFQRVLLNLENHCLFCLQPQQVETLLEVQRWNPTLSKDPLPIIHYLTGTDPSYDRTDAELEEMGIPARATFPPMTCPPCYQMLVELYRLHGQLLNVQRMIQKQTELAREVITMKSEEGPSSIISSSRLQFNSTIGSSGMPADHITTVTKFVENFHSRILFESSAKKKVFRFPSCLPLELVDTTSNDPPTSGASTGCTSTNVSTNILEPSFADAEATHTPQSGKELAKPAATLIKINVSDGNDSEGTENDEDHSELEESGDPLESTGDADLSPGESEEDDRMEDPSSDDQESSSSWSPSSPEPTTAKSSKRKPKRNAFEIDPPRSKIRKTSSTRKLSASVKIESKPITRGRGRPPKHRSLLETENATSQPCDICGEVHPSSDLRDHLESQHCVQDFIKSCPNPSCLATFSCVGKLERHLKLEKFRPVVPISEGRSCRREAKLKPRYFLKKCEACSFETKSIPKFKIHLKNHEATAEKTLRCPIPDCALKFGLRQSVENHLVLHNDKSSSRRVIITRKHRCDICGKRIPAMELFRHLEGHNLKDYITKCPNPQCTWAFSSRIKMERHVIDIAECKRNAEPPISVLTRKCEVCQVEVNKLRFKKHLQHHEFQLNDKTLTCPLLPCPERYALRQSMEEHIMSHDYRLSKGVDKQDCSLCKKTIKTKNVTEHLKKAHQVKEPITCRRCPFTFHDWEALLDHTEKHRFRKGRIGFGGGGFFCDMCNDDTTGPKFRTYEFLRQHYFNVHQIGKQFTCRFCNRGLYSQRTFNFHQNKYHPNEEMVDEPQTKGTRPKTIECDQCPGVYFSIESSLETHKIKVHGAPLVNCKFCGEAFNCISALVTHERAHVGLFNTYKCRVESCSQIFQSKALWRQHDEEIHNPKQVLKQFICESCGKGFKNKKYLNRHVKAMHLGETGDTHICELCGESFDCKAAIKRHRLKHTREQAKPRHKCDICGEAFRRKKLFKAHLKSH